MEIAFGAVAALGLLAPVLSMFLLGLLTLIAPLLVMAVPLALVALVVFALGATRGDANPAVPSAQASAPAVRAPIAPAITAR